MTISLEQRSALEHTPSSPVHAASVTTLEQSQTQFPWRLVWLYLCLHPPISSTCLQWLEKLTLSYILAKDPFLSFPFSHESMMIINLFMLFPHSVGLCLFAKVVLWGIVILKLQCAPEFPGDLGQTQISGLCPQEFLIQRVWGRDRNLLF